MTTQICFKCQQELPLDCFYKHPQMKNGVLGKCKECTKKDVSENYATNREKYSKYEAMRRQRPERKKQQAESLQRQAEKNPHKATARRMTANAIRSGKLKRLPCEKCGNPKSQAHHDDYSKPLEVRWLCFVHHREVHGQVVTAITYGSGLTNDNAE